MPDDRTSLVDLIVAADDRAKDMQDAEPEETRTWFELRGLRSTLQVALSQAVSIEKRQ